MGKAKHYKLKKCSILHWHYHLPRLRKRSLRRFLIYGLVFFPPLNIITPPNYSLIICAGGAWKNRLDYAV